MEDLKLLLFTWKPYIDALEYIEALAAVYELAIEQNSSSLAVVLDQLIERLFNAEEIPELTLFLLYMSYVLSDNNKIRYILQKTRSRHVLIDAWRLYLDYQAENVKTIEVLMQRIIFVEEKMESLSPDDKWRAVWLMLKVCILTSFGAYKVAVQLFNFIAQRLAMTKTNFEKTAFIRAFNCLSWAYAELGKLYAAQEILNQARLLAEELQDSYGLAWLLNTQGHILLKQGKTIEADKIRSQFLHQMEMLDSVRGLAIAYINLADLYVTVGRLSDAEEMLLKAKELFGGVISPIEFTTYVEIALRLAQNKIDEAEALVKILNEKYSAERIQYWPFKLLRFNILVKLRKHEYSNLTTWIENIREFANWNPYPEVQAELLFFKGLMEEIHFNYGNARIEYENAIIHSEKNRIPHLGVRSIAALAKSLLKSYKSSRQEELIEEILNVLELGISKSRAIGDYISTASFKLCEIILLHHQNPLDLTKSNLYHFLREYLPAPLSLEFFERLIQEIDQIVNNTEAYKMLRLNYPLIDLVIDILEDLSLKVLPEIVYVAKPHIYGILVVDARSSLTLFDFFLDKDLEANVDLLGGILSVIQQIFEQVLQTETQKRHSFQRIQYQDMTLLTLNSERVLYTLIVDSDNYTSRYLLREFMLKFEEEFKDALAEWKGGDVKVFNGAQQFFLDLYHDLFG